MHPAACSGFKNEATFKPVSAYYSVDYPGVAHIVSLANYIPYGPDSAQYKWFLQDLASGEGPRCVRLHRGPAPTLARLMQQQHRQRWRH